LCGGRSTNYYTYSGSGIYEGKGEASKNIKRIDIWLVGTPPREFRIIGHITNSRPGRVIPMAGRGCGSCSRGEEKWGDGLLLKAERTDFLGTYSTGNATAVSSGNVTTAVGSGVSVPSIRGEGQYFVIKYWINLPMSEFLRSFAFVVICYNAFLIGAESQTATVIPANEAAAHVDEYATIEGVVVHIQDWEHLPKHRRNLS
jgi:hypothetical protein